MSQQSPLVSLGLPVYNGEAFLVEALDSLLAQTFSDFEIIISDNASTDATESISRAYAAKDDRIRYVRNKENVGASGNYNQAFRMARGKYFKWAAHDDALEPTLLEACVEVLNEQADVVVCYPRTLLFDELGRVLEEYSDDLDLRQEEPSARFIKLLETPGWCNPIFGLMRTDTLAKTPLIANYPRSDRNLLAELTLHGQFCELPEYLFRRRVHPEISTEVHTSEDDLAAWFDTSHSGKAVYPRWRRYSDYAAMVRRAPISMREKMRIYQYLSRFVFSTDKIGALIGDVRNGVSAKLPQLSA